MITLSMIMPTNALATSMPIDVPVIVLLSIVPLLLAPISMPVPELVIVLPRSSKPTAPCSDTPCRSTCCRSPVGRCRSASAVPLVCALSRSAKPVPLALMLPAIVTPCRVTLLPVTVTAPFTIAPRPGWPTIVSPLFAVPSVRHR